MATQVARHDLERLHQLYDKGFHNTFLDNALRKIITHQIDRDETDLQRVNNALMEFERQYEMSSEEFWDRYRAGALGDRADFVEWNAFYKMGVRITTRLNILRGSETRE